MPSANENKIKLEEKLYNQLGVNAATLREWEKDSYPVDGEVVSKFWKEIELTPCIEIVGDYDVDGICASHILSTAIKNTYPDKKVKVRIPRRFSEGYGINEAIATEIMETLPKGSLIITVDNGIAAGEVLDKIKDAGYKVIVTDHHSAREGLKLPKPDMLIDPAVSELSNPLTGNYWCGAGVAFKLCEPAINEELAKELEVFAGLATVADCMELKEGNWAIVRKAIKAFRDKNAPKSLQMLLSKMGQDPDFCNEEHFGFYLGPAFNAPGRLLDRGAVEVLKYLHNPTEEGCERLVSLNNQRKAIRDEEFAMVKQYIDSHGLAETNPIWVAYDGLHEGIVGILAGKIAEEYKRPAIVLTNIEDKSGMYKGSARSYGEFNIFEYLSSMPELFTKMGGHKGAAGLSMTKECFDLAKAHQLDAQLVEEMAINKDLTMPIQKWEIPGINSTLNKFRPFGEGNAAPKFEIEVDTQKDEAKFIGEGKNHLFISDSKHRWKVTHFNHVPNTLSDNQHFGMIGTISGSAFAGHETPSFNAESVFDIVDDREKGR